MVKIVTTSRDGFGLRWYNNPKNSLEINCDVSHRGIIVLEWAFPKLAGRSVSANATVLTSQAVIYAKEAIIKDYCLEKIKGRIVFKHPKNGFGLMENKQVVWFTDDDGGNVCIVFASVENLLKSDWKFVSYEPANSATVPV